MLKDSNLDPHYIHIYSPAQGNAEGRNCHLTQSAILNEVFLKSLHPGASCMGHESKSGSIAFVTTILRVTRCPVSIRLIILAQPSEVVYSSSFSSAVCFIFNKLVPTVFEFH